MRLKETDDLASAKLHVLGILATVPLLNRNKSGVLIAAIDANEEAEEKKIAFKSWKLHSEPEIFQQAY